MGEPTTESRWQSGLVVLACAAYACGLTLSDPDLWGHTLYGLRAVEQGVAAERTDPFAYTVEHSPWVNHEWLVEWQFGWLWSRFGNTGLWWWRNAMVAVVFAATWVAARRANASTAGVVAVVVPTAICLSQFACFIRPQLATYALLAVTLVVCRRFAESTRPPLSIWVLPPLMVLWTNLHGGFLAGLGILLIVWLDSLRRAWSDPTRRRGACEFGFVVLLGTLGTFATPYGPELHQMLWYHLGTGQIVSEWQPVWATRLAPAYAVPFVLPVVALVGSRRWTLLEAAILTVVAFQAAMHLKHVALLCVTCLILLPGPMSDVTRSVFRRIHAQWSGPGRGGVRWAATTAILLIVGGLQLQSTLPMWRHGIRPWDVAVSTTGYVPGVPVAAVRFLNENGLAGNVVTDYGWAQFVIWHLHPESRIAFDGRYRTVYPPQLEREYVEFVNAVEGAEGEMALLDGYDTDIVLVSTTRRAVVQYVAERSDWMRVFEDEQSVVFVRAETARLHALAEATSPARTPAVTWEIFPGVSGPQMNVNESVSAR